LADTEPTKGPAIPSAMQEIGDSALRRTGGYVREDFLPELLGLQAARTYREMSYNDPVIGAIQFAMKMLISRAEWDVQPADDTPAAQEEGEFVEGMMGDMVMSWGSMIMEALTMLTYGYAPMEVVWKRRGGQNPDKMKSSKFDDGMIVPAKIALRAQYSITQWEFDEVGNPTWFWQMTETRGMLKVPLAKCLLFRTTEELNNPLGYSILRNAYRPWLFKNRIEEIEGIGIERDLAGLPVMKIPAAYMADDADQRMRNIYEMCKNLVRGIRRDKEEGVILPSDMQRDGEGKLTGNPGFALELLSTGGSRQFDTTKIIDRYDHRIATSTLADFIFLGQQAVGSFALSSDKTALFSQAIGGFLDMIENVLNSLVETIWRLNGKDVDLMPTLKHGDVETPNLTELGTYISALVGAGAQLFPDVDLENRLRSFGGLPEAPEDREVVDDPTTAAILGRGGTPQQQMARQQAAKAATDEAKQAEKDAAVPAPGGKRPGAGTKPPPQRSNPKATR
jgi:hypothetical protein